MVHVTTGLLDALLEMAAEAEPGSVNVVVSATPAREFEAELAVDPETPVLTHFYFPETGRSVRSVFGMDLSTPSGRGRARFLSHPDGDATLTEADDLAGVVFVAVPPWDRSSVVAYDRSGRTLELSLVEAEPPAEEVV